MGKSKDDHKLKRSSSSPRDESRSKRRRSKDDDDKEHKSSKKHKSHSTSKHKSRKEEKSSGKRKHKDQKHDKLPKLNINIQELTDEDYFSKNNEFSTWLKEEKNMFFTDLSSDAARSLFSKFVAKWNNQELEPQYYEGIATAPRTSHKWNIKK